MVVLRTSFGILTFSVGYFGEHWRWYVIEAHSPTAFASLLFFFERCSYLLPLLTYQGSVGLIRLCDYTDNDDLQAF